MAFAKLKARSSGRPSTSSPIITKWPFRNRSSGFRVVVKLNSESFQWWTLRTRSWLTVLMWMKEF